MRVIAGSAGGIRLDAPRDRQTRPITDRVKETLFAILGERVVDARVLDLYAGSGAIGIEALSRGAAHATFVERSRDAVELIRRNLRRTHLDSEADVLPVDGRALPGQAPMRAIGTSWSSWIRRTRSVLSSRRSSAWDRCWRRARRWSSRHFWRTPIPAPDGLQTWRERRFGETALTFLEVP